MSRRNLPHATSTPAANSSVSFRDSSLLVQSDPTYAANLQQLRQNWKWAAFSQFCFTFSQLLAMDDVSLSDIEDDLTCSTALYLPRLIHRLLYTLTQDRKITLDNWQIALHKQYLRRNPEANPLGIESALPSRKHTREPSVSQSIVEDRDNRTAEPTHDLAPAKSEVTEDTELPEDKPDIEQSAPDVTTAQEDHTRNDFLGEGPPLKDEEEAESGGELEQEQEDSKDWLELPMLAKLESLWLLMEWQFQNPNRLRSIMKDDDETAQWRIEPIGYDAKTNAYWLIGADRLWIQRVPPKPPRPLKRKRAAPSKPKASSSKVEAHNEPQSDTEQTVKRSRRPPAPANGRVSRSQRKTVAVAAGGGKSTRAAKLQANKKLDAQAKELAEFQRQTAAAEQTSPRSARQTRARAAKPVTSPSVTRRQSLGTRTSARLRGKVDEDEWQQVPDEWLHELSATEAGDVGDVEDKKGKARAEMDADEEGDDEDAEGEPDMEIDAEADVEDKDKIRSENGDESSELTELSEELEERGNSGKDGQVVVPQEAESGPGPGNRKTRSSRKAAVKPVPPVDFLHATVEPVDEMLQDAIIPVPDNFVEWETICVTLDEWEHIAERFEKSTNYREKALYKVLTQTIAPVITAELREAMRKRRLEEAVVHRKRSSRIATKESEKEQARLSAKQKAEEAEKLARARRLEARLKKEEADREKREHAREQRRLEREEKDRRTANRQSRSQRSGDIDVVDQQPPSSHLNGTHSTESVQLSAVTTPSGVHTPDWILDCEICHKRGLNVDDGLPMVSCGVCAKWQHISCHDLVDHQAGRPRRNWDTQKFFCTPCRMRLSGTNGVSSHHQQHMRDPQYAYKHQSPPGFASNSRGLPSQYTPLPLLQNGYPQPMSDIRSSQRSPFESGMSYSQAPQYARTNDPPIRPRSQTGITFAHYQPEQRGFSTRSHHDPPSAPPWTNGHASVENHAMRQSPTVQFVQQQFPNNAGYSVTRMPTSYNHHSVPQLQAYASQSEYSQPVQSWSAGSMGSNGHLPLSNGGLLGAEPSRYVQGVSATRPPGSVQPSVPTYPQSNGNVVDHSYLPQDMSMGMGGAPSYNLS